MSAAFSSARSLLLAAIVALGITAAWFTVVVWIFSLAEQSRVRQGNYEQLYVRVDGVPVIVRQGANGSQQQVLSLDREPTTGDTYQLLYPSYVAARSDQPSVVSSRQWTNRLAALSDGGAPPTYWYLVHDGRVNGRTYGIGYNSASKRAVGYFSRTGFSERLPARETWFEVQGDTGLAYATPERTYYEPSFFTQPSLYLLADNKLWQINTRTRKVKSLVDCPDAEAIGWAWRTGDSLPEAVGPIARQSQAEAPRSLIVRTPDAALVVEPDSGKIDRYSLPKRLRQASLAAFQLTDRRLLLIEQPLSTTEGQSVAWIDPAAKASREKRVTIDGPQVTTDEPTVAAVTAVAAPALVWQLLMLGVLALQKWSMGQADSPAAAVSYALTIGWPALLFDFALSAAGAAAAYRRQRRFGLPGAIAWAIFAFVFGAAGWIAYRWHRAWPPLEECPACDQPAPRDRAACTECGAAFPPPELKGIEVFA
jgi:hypothetical protein